MPLTDDQISQQAHIPIDQQQRMILATQQDCASMLDLATRIQTRLTTYQRLDYAHALSDESFIGTGATAKTYGDAIAALSQFAALPDLVWSALEAFAR